VLILLFFQEEKILEIYKKSGEKSAELRQGKSFRDMSDEERQEMMAKMQAVTAERAKERKGLLSAEQQQQYDEYLKEMEKRRAERMQQRPQN
jgi:topoisomerase IA-like protein